MRNRNLREYSDEAIRQCYEFLKKQYMKNIMLHGDLFSNKVPILYNQQARNSFNNQIFYLYPRGCGYKSRLMFIDDCSSNSIHTWFVKEAINRTYGYLSSYSICDIFGAKKYYALSLSKDNISLPEDYRFKFNQNIEKPRDMSQEQIYNRFIKPYNRKKANI